MSQSSMQQVSMIIFSSYGMRGMAAESSSWIEALRHVYRNEDYADCVMHETC